MNILITGAAGGIGSTLAFYLSNKKHNIFLIDNFNNGYKENLTINGKTFGTFYEKDICCKNLSKDLNNSYDCIIHLAAITSLPDCEKNVQKTIDTNVTGTSNILECARIWGVPHVIFASTSAVYENNIEPVFTEDLTVKPNLWYSLSKKMGEDLCNSYQKNYNLKITTLRFFNVFGPRQDIHRKNPPLLNYLVKQLKSNTQPILHSDGNQQRDYIYINDVISLIEICLEKQPNDLFNVCSSSLLSVKDIVECVYDVFPIKKSPIYRSATMLWDSHPQLFETHYPLNKNIVEKEANKFSLGSYKKAYNILNWKPNTDLKTLIKNVVKEIKI
jgi:nucleoside-diphosphate-sugar epimerase